MDFLSLETFLFLLIISAYLYFQFFTSPKKSKPTTTGFRTYPFLGSLPQFLKNRHRFLDWTTEVLTKSPTNSAVFFRPGKVHGVITANPSVVEHILKTNFENYPKGDRFILLLRDFLGGGIFNSDGELWRVQRKTASYAFSANSLRNFVMENLTVEIQSRLIPCLAKAEADSRCRLDLQDVLERFAFDNVCKLAFNVDPACLGGGGATGSDEFMKAFEDAATLSSGRFMYVSQSMLKLKKFLNVGSERRLRESIETVHGFADDIIRSRMKSKSDDEGEGLDNHQDLLSRFIGIDEDHNSPEFLRDIVISMILAGRDTTSSALSWFFWLLSSRPHVERAILEELESIRARTGKHVGFTYSFEELREMHYLHAAISEAMRLYPPVPVDTKACLNDDVLPDGTVVGKGWFVTYHAYAMGRMEAIWGKSCREYLPERWLKEDGTCQQESVFRYPIFHAGPRMCLGKDLAYIQMKSIAASVLEMFEINVQNKDTCPEHQLSLTLRMKGGLPVTVRRRNESDGRII